MNIAMSPTRERYPLSFKKIIKKTIVSTASSGIVALVFFAGITVTSLTVPNEGGSGFLSMLWLIVLGLLLLVALWIVGVYFYQRWYFATYFYDLTKDFITIRKGPITPREITIPYERIQDVYVDQDFWDRVFGLYDVHLSSATISSGTSAHIDGLGKAAAEGMRDALLKTLNERLHRAKQQSAPQTPQS